MMGKLREWLQVKIFNQIILFKLVKNASDVMFSSTDELGVKLGRIGYDTTVRLRPLLASSPVNRQSY